MKMKMKDCMYLWHIFTLFICLAMKLRTVDAVGSKILYRPVQIGANTNLSFALKEPLSYNRSVDYVLWLFNGRIIDKGDNDHFKFLNLSLEISKMTSSMEGIYQRRLFFSDGTDQNDSCTVYLSDETRTILGKMLVSHDEPSRGTLNLTLTTISQLNKPEIISVMKDGKKMCEFTARRKSVLDSPYKCQLVRHSSTSVTVIMSNVSTGTDFHDVTVKGLFPLEGVWRSYSVAITVLSIVTEFKADNGDIVQGDNVTLSCTVTRGLPSPRIEILKGNEVIKNSTAMETGPTTLKCYFSTISEEARGRYSCQVTIGGYTSKKDYELNVKSKPPSHDGKKGKKDGVIIAVCVVAALLLLTGLVFFIKKRCGSNKGRTDKESLPMTDMSDGYANSVHGGKVWR